MRSEIGFAVRILENKIWGKTPIDGKLRSQRWWRQRLDCLINKDENPLPVEYTWTPCQAEPIPIPYEVEFQMTNSCDCVEWLENHA